MTDHPHNPASFNVGRFDPASVIRDVPVRADWVNTFVGILDQAFNLNVDEIGFTIEVVTRLLDSIDVPDRCDPQVLPAPLALELASRQYSMHLRGALGSRPARATMARRHGEVRLSRVSWREAFLSMVTVAYPDLSPEERMLTAHLIDGLLDALSVDDRSAASVPEMVVRAAHQTSEILGL